MFTGKVGHSWLVFFFVLKCVEFETHAPTTDFWYPAISNDNRCLVCWTILTFGLITEYLRYYKDLFLFFFLNITAVQPFSFTQQLSLILAFWCFFWTSIISVGREVFILQMMGLKRQRDWCFKIHSSMLQHAPSVDCVHVFCHDCSAN